MPSCSLPPSSPQGVDEPGTIKHINNIDRPSFSLPPSSPQGVDEPGTIKDIKNVHTASRFCAEH